MRQRKALINSSANMLSFLIVFVPNLILRRVFLEELGSNWLGLNSLYSNIISWLSIAELGVGTAIIFSLYKPYANNDKKKIKAYIKFYESFYKKIGIFILIMGIIIAPFLKYFIEDNLDFKIVILTFILFILNSFISYMFSHRLCILNVSQESYKITYGTMFSKLAIIFLQVFMIKIYPSFIVYSIIQLVINLFYFILIDNYVKKKYNWLVNLDEDLDSNEKGMLLTNVRAMFIHKIGSLIVFSTDNIVISKFVGLTILGRYSNYQMIISAVQTLIGNVFNGLTSSIGNLIAEDDKEKIYDIHKKIFFLNFWIVSFVIIAFYNTLNQFVVIWVGKENLLDNVTFIIILINLYFTLMRASVTRFQEGSGHFQQDKYAALLEAIINLGCSLILVNYLGLVGVFIGTLISNLTIIFWTKPYVVYKYVFNKNVGLYYIQYFKYLLIGILTLIVTSYLSQPFQYQYSFGAFIINCLINIIIINSIYILIFYKTEEFKYYMSFIKNIVFKIR